MSEFDFEFKSYLGEPGHSCVICLAGRGGCGSLLARDYRILSNLDQTTFVGVTPFRFNTGRTTNYWSIEWYPSPIAPWDQDEAVAGLERARKEVERIISSVIEEYEIPRERIAVIGFSAGGVMSLYAATEGQKLAGVISHAGAILEPHNISPKTEANNTPMLLIHGRRDNCFDWYERYVPMKNALLEKKYSVKAFEHYGSHWVNDSDVVIGAKFLAPYLGYADYQCDEFNRIKRQHKRSPIQVAKKEAIPQDVLRKISGS